MMLEGETAPIVDTNWLNQNAAWVKSKRQYVLSIFQFPTDRLGLVVANEAEERERSAAEIHLKAEDLEIRNALRCRICGMTFEDLGTMRSHFKSEAHIANINGAGTSASIHKGSADAAMSSGGLDALGGEKDSDSESSADEGAEVGGFIIPANSDFTAFDQGLVKRVYSAQEGARTVFRRASWNKLEFSVSNAVLGSTDEHLTNETDPLTNPWPTIMRAMCTYSINSVWFVASLRSGRFAAALFDGNQVLCHKAFRRYTVRAKAGGAQSTNDNTGKRVKSIGSTLRRQGEQMLKEDIRGLLKAWAALISNSSLILLSVPKTMRPTLFDEENSVILDKRDVRIRYVPFMTDKPTFETIQSIHTVCSTVYFKEITDSPFRIDDADEREGSLPQTVQTVSKLSANLLAIKEEDSIIQRSALISCPESVRLFDILQRFTNDIENKDKTDLLASIDECLQCIISFYGKNHVGDGIFIGAADDNVDSCSPVASLALSREMSLNLNAEEVVCLPGSLDDLWTALHWASSIGMPELISRLLIAGADPTARDVRNRTPYYLCKTKEARDAFRRYRATAELKWNWTDAGVPEALTTEMERIQKEKEKEKKKRAKLKKAEQKEKQDGMELEQLEEVDYMTVAKTTEPPKARAFAAGDCACCSKSLFRVTPTSINGQDCCSQECAAKLKRKLAADAALARFKNSSSAINK